MQDIRAGKIEPLVVYKLDRLGRSLPHLALVLDELNRLKVPLIASSQGIDTSDDNPAGRLQLGVLMAVAEFERGIIKERVNAGLAAAKARRVRLGCPATINGRAEEVRKLKAKGLGVRAVARELKMPPSSFHKALQLAARGRDMSRAWSSAVLAVMPLVGYPSGRLLPCCGSFNTNAKVTRSQAP
jgi:DNA invertase Pin-like site-specific DNA recombinase